MIKDYDYLIAGLIYDGYANLWDLNEQIHFTDSYLDTGGASKTVLVFQKLGFVLKTDNGDDEGATRAEYDNYCKAKEMGIEKILLPTEIFCIENGIVFTRQPYYNGYFNYISLEAKVNTSKAVFKTIEKRLYSCIDGLWLERAIQYYGKSFMKQFAKWTRKCNINDLHSDNIGFVGNYRPIIFDYAGYGVRDN